MHWQRGKAYSQDLRERVLAAADDSLRVGQIAVLLRVSVSYVSKSAEIISGMSSSLPSAFFLWFCRDLLAAAQASTVCCSARLEASVGRRFSPGCSCFERPCSAVRRSEDHKSLHKVRSSCQST